VPSFEQFGSKIHNPGPGWHWRIHNYDMDNIAKFKDTGADNQDTTIDYNTACAQSSDYYGTAYVAVGPISEDSTYPDFERETLDYEGSDWVYDISEFVVDYGYCTSDADCQDDGCPNSVCDLTTSHCTPEITSVSPADEPVGKGGCLTINGCYFGPSRLGQATCTCTDDEDPSLTCEVHEGDTTCLLAGAKICELESECNADNSSYSGSGKVNFISTNSYEADYLNANLCDDTWNNEQVIVGIPETGITAGEYDIQLTSYYGLETTYSAIEVSDTPTPCLCRVEPERGQEGTSLTLYGKYFNQLDSSSRVAEFAVFGHDITTSGRWIELDASEYGDNAYQVETTVATGATSDDENGIQLADDNGVVSNAKAFTVSCLYNSDCATRCCQNGVCAEAEVCNECEDLEDCTYGNCYSTCTDGMCEPYIISISPDKGNVGQPITIQGCHFGSYYAKENSSDYGGLYSHVTLNDIETEFACNENETWNNEEIKIIAPDGVFADTNEAEVAVTQVYKGEDGNYYSQTSSSGQDYCSDSNCNNEDDCENICESEWHATKFSEDDSCQDVDIPVLCTIEPSNGPYTTDREAHTLTGYNFYDQTVSYCECEGEYGTSCQIEERASSCELSYSYDCYVDPADETAVCDSTISANDGKNYYVDGSVEACSEAYYTNEADCVANGGTWSTLATILGSSGACRCLNPDDDSQYCWVEEGSSYCTFSYNDTCYLDGYEEDNTLTCTPDHSDYKTLGTEVLFAYNQNADWIYGSSTELTTNVPEEAESGNVYVQATDNSSGAQCQSNGLDFEVTCNSCSDCADGLMCDLTQGEDEDGNSYGICTAATSGFCAEEPDSCCGNTGCRETILEDGCTIDEDGDGEADTCEDENGCLCYNEDNTNYCLIEPGANSCDISDGGVCYERPLLLEEESNPINNEEDVCPNVEITLQFDMAVITSDAVANDEEPDFGEYVKMVDESVYTELTNGEISFSEIDEEKNELKSVERDTTTSLILNQKDILSPTTTYYILIYSSPADNNTGLVDANNYVSLGCTDEQIAAGICSEDSDMWVIKFTTSDEAGGCPPKFVELEAADEDFVDASYTFISPEEEQKFIARVYASDNDIRGDDDDEAITGITGVLDWDYQWDPQYDSLEDLENSQCPIVGIITSGDYGTCTCNLGETECTVSESSCIIAYGEASCEINDYGTSETCYYDEASCESDSGCSTCASEDGCQCTLPEESCTYAYGEPNCELAERGISISDGQENVSCVENDTSNEDYICEVNYGESSCETNSGEMCELEQTCDDDYDGYHPGEFLENQRTQTVTADNKEGEGWVTVRIVGDGSEDHNWEGEIEDSQFVRVLFCDDYDYLSSYDDDEMASEGIYTDTQSYHFAFAYCRGSDPNNLLPDFDISMIKGASASEEYLQEYLFTNDINEDLIGIIIYPNDLDGDPETIYDAVQPGTWTDLRLEEFGSASETTLDGYEAVEDDHNMLVAAANLDESSSTLYPNIYMISVNKDATSDTLAVLEQIKEHWSFNTNSAFASDTEEGCQAEKEALIRDTKRITDLGEINYLLASYYYGTDSEEVYPDIAEGSYIRYLTTSVWPSWDAILGNAVGRALPTDPYNEFYTDGYCEYDEEAGTYYDTSGTCWDPINKNYTCPEDSYVYQYQYISNDDGSGSYKLYANLEYDDESWSWNNYSGDPCADEEYASSCACFDYEIDSDSLGDFYYGTCDTDSQLCNSDSGFKSGSFCESDTDCQIVQ